MSLLCLFLSLTLVMVRQMTDGERWRAIGMLDAGMSIRDVARTVGRSHKAIRKLLIKTRATGSVSHASSGRPRRRCTNLRADRRLIRPVRGNPTMPATLLRLMWDQRNRQGNLLSSQTIRRRIKERAPRCNRMRKRQRLSPAHVASRERWAKQRIHWRQNQWQRIIFTDERRFRLFRADGRIGRLILSMPRRVTSLLLARGGYTRYYFFFFVFLVFWNSGMLSYLHYCS